MLPAFDLSASNPTLLEALKAATAELPIDDLACYAHAGWVRTVVPGCLLDDVMGKGTAARVEAICKRIETRAIEIHEKARADAAAKAAAN